MRRVSIHFGLGLKAALLFAVSVPAPAWGQTTESARLTDVIVTGSRLPDAQRLSSVEVLGEDAIASVGGDASRLPALLAANSGSEALVDQLNQPQSSGTAQFNLRNLGLGSTLVLVDGQRWTYSAVVSTDGSAYTDINSLVPSIALRRIEVVKDGASAIYGSDAVAGVVNFVTRRAVERPEVSVTHDVGQGFEETAVQGLAGYRISGTDLTLAALHFHRSPLGSDERDFTQAARYGRAAWTAVTSFGQPGSYFRPSQSGFVADPDCANPAFPASFRIGATDAFCRLDYSDFFDLLPEEERTQLFADVGGGVSGLQIWTQTAWSSTFTRVRQSPSLPILARSLTVPASHPDNPFGETVFFRGRLLGAEAGASTADFAYETWRLAGGVSGTVAGWRWSASATTSRQHVAYDKPDVIGSALQNALNGLGGPECDPRIGQAGVGACRYFNPFGSARLGTGTRNPPDLVATLIGSTGLRGAATLWTLEAQADRRVAEGRWGSVDLVLGGQVRANRLRHDWSDLVNAGELLTAGFSPDFDGDQRIRAAFAEARVRLGDAVEIQAAARHEGQGEDGALSPRIAGRWDPLPALALRVSWGRGYRIPSVFTTQGALAAQPSVFDRGAFVFVNTLAAGNEELRPERSESASLGLVWRPAPDLSVHLDGWRFESDDLVIKEQAQSIIDQADRDSVAGLMGTPSQRRVVREPGGALTAVQLSFVNASAVLTQGVDLSAVWAREWGPGRLGLTARWTYVDRYDIRLAAGQPAISGVGSTNLNTLARSLPRNRGRVELAWTGVSDQITLTASYTDSYRNDRSGITDTRIAEFTSFDLSYARTLFPGLEVIVAGMNLADDDPPLAQFALGYDPIVADPRGRVLRLTIKKQL